MIPSAIQCTISYEADKPGPRTRWHGSVGRYVLWHEHDGLQDRLRDQGFAAAALLLRDLLTTGDMVRGVSLPLGRVSFAIYCTFAKGRSPTVRVVRFDTTGAYLRSHQLSITRRYVRNQWFAHYGEKLPRAAMCDYEAALRIIRVGVRVEQITELLGRSLQP